MRIPRALLLEILLSKRGRQLMVKYPLLSLLLSSYGNVK